ncbi:hypothetical protein J7L13_01695 [bacterium]|nr:hypothetical protein [bacterium]
MEWQKVAEEVEVIQPQPSPDFENKTFTQQQEEILRQIQGEVVLLKEKLPFVFLLMSFALAREVSPAVFFQTKGKIFCLFNFLSSSSLLPFEAENTYAFPLSLPQKSSFSQVQSFNLSHLPLSPDELASYLKKKVKLSEVAVLKGKGSFLPTAVLLRALFGRTGEIWFEKGKTKVRIY